MTTLLEAAKQALEALVMTINFEDAVTSDGYAEYSVCTNGNVAADWREVRKTITNLRAAIEQAEKCEPVAWCVAYDDPRLGRIHSNPSMYQPEIDAHVKNCEGRIVKVNLYAHPASQVAIPEGWQLVPKEPTQEMLDAITNAIYDAVGSRASSAYKAMLAAAPKPGEQK